MTKENKIANAARCVQLLEQKIKEKTQNIEIKYLMSICQYSFREGFEGPCRHPKQIYKNTLGNCCLSWCPLSKKELN